jgi:hypothetical protein
MRISAHKLDKQPTKARKKRRSSANWPNIGGTPDKKTLSPKS